MYLPRALTGCRSHGEKRLFSNAEKLANACVDTDPLLCQDYCYKLELQVLTYVKGVKVRTSERECRMRQMLGKHCTDSYTSCHSSVTPIPS